VPNEDGTIVHAQLTFGNEMIMFASVLQNATEFGRLNTVAGISVATIWKGIFGASHL
jgi:hypothetical protein